jgi:uncharacterized protein DUF3800
VDFFFADDSKQRPSRAGMGPLVAVGGVHVPGESVRRLELGLDTLCAEFGFPEREEFKWSPGPELWMRSNLVAEDRTEFFTRAIGLARAVEAKAMVMIEDKDRRNAGTAATHEEDVVNLFLERANEDLLGGREGVVIVDTPSGSRADEDRFLGHCLDTIQQGTPYVRFDRIALNVISTKSKLIRLLQLADVVTSCTLAYVGGETRWSAPVFKEIKTILRSDYGRFGGCGVKIHPDLRYRNLYYWLLGDSHFVRYQMGVPLPSSSRPYSGSPSEP